ncbi:hypothetical protein [Jeotgalibacillus haloalkalitolerans]|uniref:Uncharacterized protein n=1 Tax=Jeotgalibacillus haloalkalitolerans TaxID=3104292 RepID=A0ABU5KKR6_9BACL|nr:hypothetical protein [Jeotgalibacillus sp. HH7-29]MDZ5711673.1 hypothetical protein [Jeotgalibacillus sp. HH7-29]
MKKYNPVANWPATMMLLTALDEYRVSFLEEKDEGKIYFKVKKEYYENFVFEFNNNTDGSPSDNMYDLCEYIENKELCVQSWVERRFDFVRCHKSSKTPAG